MMDCRDYKNWMKHRDDYDDDSAADAVAHEQSCESCRKVGSLDSLIEESIGSELKAQEVPRELLKRIETDIRSFEEETLVKSIPWKFAAIALAAAVMLCFVAYPFLSKFAGGEKLSNVDEIGALAVRNHLVENMAMEIKEGDGVDLTGWFAKRIGLAVRKPDFRDMGMRFLGARVCKLGSCYVAYLFYERKGRRVSVFVIDKKDVGFPINPGITYETAAQGCNVKIWNNGGQICAMVT